MPIKTKKLCYYTPLAFGHLSVQSHLLLQMWQIFTGEIHMIKNVAGEGEIFPRADIESGWSTKFTVLTNKKAAWFESD